mmetsp:Transcript_35814/g.106891  ORF Transcript_35814/g.106891 Transcript_35814/m.106891 type:complete len:100 (-) Transcript_35814:198-497(-)
MMQEDKSYCYLGKENCGALIPTTMGWSDVFIRANQISLTSKIKINEEFDCSLLGSIGGCHLHCMKTFLRKDVIIESLLLLSLMKKDPDPEKHAQAKRSS